MSIYSRKHTRVRPDEFDPEMEQRARVLLEELLALIRRATSQ